MHKKLANGLTMYICFGKYGGWKAQKDGPTLRLTMGIMAVSVGFFDIEIQLTTMLKHCQRVEADRQSLFKQFLLYESDIKAALIRCEKKALEREKNELQDL